MQIFQERLCGTATFDGHSEGYNCCTSEGGRKSPWDDRDWSGLEVLQASPFERLNSSFSALRNVTRYMIP